MAMGKTKDKAKAGHVDTSAAAVRLAAATLAGQWDTEAAANDVSGTARGRWAAQILRACAAEVRAEVCKAEPPSLADALRASLAPGAPGVVYDDTDRIADLGGDDG